ncbi:MAG: sigma-70 family RNA polymerase sigma factor, partial [Thermoleophilaceae bacterium]|nr:sigma-70 family RNA polymerase sigma factor [Thermoleophilaceae bacterium]
MRDETLARLAATGDRPAFGQIFERYHQPLYRYCLSILRDPEDAADVLQTVMARALKALDGEQRAIDLKPWLYRIAHNESIGLIRTRSRGAVDGPTEEIAANPDRGPEGEFLAKERLAQLVQDMAELPERQRGALTMRELNGLAYPEIAAALEISEQAARQSVYEARKMLFEFSAGRELRCEDVRRQVSEHDKGFPRGRGVRAHLRSCSGCQDFRSAIGARRSDLHMLSPALAAPAAAALFQGVVGAGASGLGGGGGLAALLGAGGAQGVA